MNPNQLTPFDSYVADLLGKQAVDALVPGQVGYGPNPGTTGSLDSDPAQAANSDVAMLRAQQSTAPILARLDADGGAGYSHPAPGMGPGLQMHADVKAAAVVDEAIGYAEQCYLASKQAGRLTDAAGAVGQAAKKLLGRAEQGSAMAAAAPAAAHAGPSPDNVVAHARHLAGAAGAKVQAGAAAAQQGAAELTGQAQTAMSNAAQHVQAGVRNAADRGRALVAADPVAAAGIGAATMAVGAGGGALAAGIAQNRQLEAQKQASLDEAYEAGRRYARQQCGLAY